MRRSALWVTALATIGVSIGSQIAAAQEPEEASKAALTELLHSIQSLRADFLQRLLADNGDELQVLEGKLIALSPTLFLWEIEQPYNMTYLLRDLDLAILDPDLNQVTYRELDAEDIPIIALLLNRDTDVLDGFSVTQGQSSFRLEPLDSRQLFQSITVYFDEARIDAIDVRDAQDRLTEFSFRNVEVNPALADEIFELTIPEDIEVIGEPPT